MINTETKLYFSVANSPGSFGATLYNTAFQELGINAIYKPLKLEDTNKFPVLLKALQVIGAAGLSVSMPFKKIAKNLSWSSHKDAFRIGNCNTLTFENESIYGDNTDWTGFITACNNILEKTKGVVIYGTGAVSDSIAYALDKKHIPFRKVSRKNVYLLNNNNCNFLINATPTGMEGVKDDVFNETIINQFKYVFDVVVSKEPTNLIKLANNFNLYAIPGCNMSLYQLCEQWKLYTKQEAPFELFTKILIKNGYFLNNVKI